MLTNYCLPAYAQHRPAVAAHLLGRSRPSLPAYRQPGDAFPLASREPRNAEWGNIPSGAIPSFAGIRAYRRKQNTVLSFGGTPYLRGGAAGSPAGSVRLRRY